MMQCEETSDVIKIVQEWILQQSIGSFGTRQTKSHHNLVEITKSS